MKSGYLGCCGEPMSCDRQGVWCEVCDTKITREEAILYVGIQADEAKKVLLDAQEVMGKFGFALK